MASRTQKSIEALGIWRGVLPINAMVKRFQPDGSLNPSDRTRDSTGMPASRMANA